MKLRFFVAPFVALTLALPTFALNFPVQKLVHFETQANAVAKRSEQPVLLPHVEIPVEFVGVDFAKTLDPKIATALVIEKKGKKYVRWILNPEDTKWGKELIESARGAGLDLKVEHYFVGYQTASRSYIAEDPKTGIQFSVKSSTDKTGGHWRDKKQPVGEAIDGRLLNDFLVEQNSKRAFENFIFMEEPAILKIPSIDQAVVIRDLGPLKFESNTHIYLPGFSALHDSVGAEIALKNGSRDPYAFWTEHYIKLAGKALGELAGRTGLQFDSPHSQNFLVELDSNYKPTGRLVLRDLSDLYVDQSFIEALEGKNSKTLKEFTQKQNLSPSIQAGFGPLHGNEKPSWVSEKHYSIWKNVFFKSFETSFEKSTGYDLAALNVAKEQNGDYFGANYQLSKKAEFKNFYQSMRKLGVVRNFKLPARCERLFSASGF